MTIWLLEIEHRHGHNTYACTTEEVARQRLLGYVVDEWEDLLAGHSPDTGLPEEPPEDDAAAITMYFEHSDESYSIEFTELIGARP